MKYALTFLLLCCGALGFLQANNITVSNVTLIGQDAAAGTTQIQFDLSWENSWRISVGPGNYDAAWVFAKYRVNGGAWRHATLQNTGNVAAAGSTIDVADNVGAFIYRSADGSGDVDWQNLQLRWDYDANGVDDNAVVDVQVFAIEMVYVPEGAFRMGSPLSGAADLRGEFFTRTAPPISLQVPYEVTSEAAITVANGQGTLFYANNEPGANNNGDQLGPIPAAFPKGFNAFYCMKYETSQEQWVAFFNSLTPAQQANLDLTGSMGKNSDEVQLRNGISWADNGNATTSLPNVAVNYAATLMTLAYLDWSGLRPFTELEYEKACRGPLAPVASELAWGNANVTSTLYEVSNAGAPNEGVSNPGVGTGNMVFFTSTAIGPLRVGALAASAVNSTREESGGSYYGIMELSGNLYERAVTVGNPAGRAFTGAHGDGVITTAGAANVTGWPTTATGIGYRGGSYSNTVPFCAVSDRFDAATTLTNGNARLGFRGARTAQ
ncbi:SUMF1/EgtB/PvdO family nonheme iron enzyme [Neolewinella lacunae]|uniref:SUMF1/EgtB/PvdO family nonheme iron enzyme n=1 Tax=Neolewinella lacunae TaxID=1517758 RepID=A0A923T6Q7_9BACT|nr:SUMF1/EgtB/PvdO family nonheme iron enzyme [Neolewinella lacunae]MBC6992846.1 SUMF1/EgtB/PvdO family nonheme iron enzyme [Neolewinella lacunae]MDN3633790.1 SUMF1/EgtB/PvdO family nonheme iron enzyme [Neolewinella lacunae]